MIINTFLSFAYSGSNVSKKHRYVYEGEPRFCNFFGLLEFFSFSSVYFQLSRGNMVDALNSLLCLCHRNNLGITDVLKLFCKEVSAQLLFKWEIGSVGMQCLRTS